MDFTLYNRIRNALYWLIPDLCIECNVALSDPRHPCCDSCYDTLPFQTSTCQQCGQRLSAGQQICGRCLIAPPEFDHCFCPFEYTAAVREQIIRFKYQKRPELAQILAKLLVRELIGGGDSLPDLLIPVPMHPSRLRQRGYNHANLLALQLQTLLQIPARLDVVEKYRKTPQQAGLTLIQRQANNAGSFRVRENLTAKSVAIIDDVVTTGSTVREIAKILKKNGVDYIQVWGIAHTL